MQRSEKHRGSASSDSSSEASAWALMAGGIPIETLLNTSTCPNRDLTDSVILDWSFDTITIHSLTGGRSLSFVTQRIFNHHRDLIGGSDTLANEILEVVRAAESNYNPSLKPGASITYHNGVHGADVAQAFHYLIRSHVGQLDTISFLASIFAAGMHDYDHLGLTNSFLSASNHELAIKYSHKAVLEHHHCSSALSLIDEMVFSLSRNDRRRFKTVVCDMILATDISHHHELMLDFNAKQDVNINELLPLSLHAADISNNARPWAVASRWTDRLMEEFFAQGDLEGQLGLPVTPMMDRNTCNIARSQLGFLDVIAIPLYRLVNRFLDVSVCIENLETNRTVWESIET